MSRTNVKLSRILEIVVWVLMVCVVVLLITLPRCVDFMMELNTQNGSWDENFWHPRYLVTLAGSGVMALLMLWQARTLLHNAVTGKIFSNETVRCLRVFSVEALVLGAFYIGLLFFGMTKFSVVLLTLCFLLGGLIAWVFAGFFKEATEYKNENDMTI